MKLSHQQEITRLQQQHELEINQMQEATEMEINQIHSQSKLGQCEAQVLVILLGNTHKSADIFEQLWVEYRTLHT